MMLASEAHTDATKHRAERAVLQVLPRSASVEAIRAPGDPRVDLVIAGQPFQIMWIGEGSLGRAQNCLTTIRQHAANMPVLVVARHLSPGARNILSDAGVGWVDETGAAEITTRTLVISHTGQPTKQQPNLRWTNSALAVAEALICGTKPTVSATHDATGLSIGSCTKALRFLTVEGLLTTDAERGRNSARSITDTDQLLESYATAANANFDRFQMTVAILGRDPIGELATIGDRWNEHGTDWAATGLAAAAVLAPLIGRVAKLDVYVDAATQLDLNALAGSAGLKPIDGGRLTLRPFPTVTANRLATTASDLRVAPWPRVFADLRTIGVRGEEAAEHLRETVAAS